MRFCGRRAANGGGLSGYFANAQYDELLSPIVGVADTSPEGGSETTRHSERSEESHRRTDGYIFLALVVGYFACAQYDGLFFHVILNEVKNPTEELTGIYFSLWSWDISLALNMMDFLSPIVGVADTSPEGGSEECLCERSEANSREGGGLRSIFFTA